MTVKMTDHLKRWPALLSRESHRRRYAWLLQSKSPSLSPGRKYLIHKASRNQPKNHWKKMGGGGKGRSKKKSHMYNNNNNEQKRRVI
jgi:hypothetical protein